MSDALVFTATLMFALLSILLFDGDPDIADALRQLIVARAACK